MARGDNRVDVMQVVNKEILNRKENEAVAMTVDFTGVSETVNGVKIVKAGTPVDKDGKVIKATPWTGAVGILLHDVYETRPQAAMLKKAYVHVARAQASSGLTYDGKLLTVLDNAGCRIVFEEPYVARVAL